MYKPGMARGKGGRQYPYLYKDPRIVDYQEEIKVGIKATFDFSLVPGPNLIYHIVSFYYIGLLPDHQYDFSDSTNTVKPIEDAFFSLLPDLDDKHVTLNIVEKVRSDRAFILNKTAFVITPGLSPRAAALKLLTDKEEREF